MTNNQTKEESLARWVAEKVEDTVPFNGWWCSPCGREVSATFEERCDECGVPLDPDLPLSPKQYLNCKNVARKVMEYAISESAATTNMYRSERLSRAVLKFRINAWDNTPAAIEALAKACGWVEGESK